MSSLREITRRVKLSFHILVGAERVELSWITPLAPKASASANSATPPLVYIYGVGEGVGVGKRSADW